MNCPNCGHPLNSLGRKKGNYPVQNVLNTYQGGCSVRSTAQKIGLSQGTVYRILQKAGVAIRNSKIKEVPIGKKKKG
jgi:transposase-like protein